MMPQTMHILALAGALCSAAATIFIRRGLRGGDPDTGFWINVVVGTTSLWTAVIVTGGPGHRSTRRSPLLGRPRPLCTLRGPAPQSLPGPGGRAARPPAPLKP